MQYSGRPWVQLVGSFKMSDWRDSFALQGTVLWARDTANGIPEEATSAVGRVRGYCRAEVRRRSRSTRREAQYRGGHEQAGRVVKGAKLQGRSSAHPLLFKKGAAQGELVNINGVINDMIVLPNDKATRYGMSDRIEVAKDVPGVMQVAASSCSNCS